MIVTNAKKAVTNCTICRRVRVFLERKRKVTVYLASPRDVFKYFLREDPGLSEEGRGGIMRPFYEDKQDKFQCSVVKDLTFPAHLHSAVELIFLLEGSLEVTVQGQTRRLGQNEAALVFPEMVHSYQATGSSRAVLCIFAPAQVKEYYHQFRDRQPQCPFLSCGRDNPDIPAAFEHLLCYAEEPGPVRIAWLNLILAYLAGEMMLLPRDGPDKADVGYQLVSYISQHFREPLTLDFLAEELHFNKYYISRVFTGKLHCGFYEYVNRLRADYAARQLRDTDLCITQVWQEAGFESQKTFNRTFQACYQMTPSQYRKGWM